MTDQNNDAAWFAQKRFGYGAGLPLTWQGWALLGGYMITIFLLAFGDGAWRASLINAQ